MATPNLLSEKVNDITECPVCAEMMMDPKMLPCIHTFCFKCLDQHWKDRKPGDRVPCPLCRKEFDIPDGGLGMLQDNFFIQKLIDAQTVSPRDQHDGINCDICLGRKIEKVAIKFCVECQQHFCDYCSDGHLITNSTKFHQIISVEGQSTSNRHATLSGNQYCGIHENKRLEIYCKNCKSAVCTVCFLKEHKQHDGSDVTEFAEEHKKIIEQDVETIVRLSHEVDRQLEIIDYSLKHFPDTVAETERNIRWKGVEIKRLVDEHVQLLLLKLNQTKSESMKKLAFAKEELKRQKLSLNSFTNHAAEVIDLAPYEYVVSVAQQLSSRANELKNHKYVNTGGCVEVVFTPSDLQGFIKSETNIIGKFGIRENSSLSGQFAKQPTYVQHPNLISTIQFNSAIQGMVVCKRELYVITVKSSQVQVYDASTFEFKANFSVKGLRDPVGITATNQSLFLNNYYDGCIYRVDFPERKVTSWKVGVNCNRLSITKLGNILVTAPELNKLREYTPSGTLLRTIPLQPKIGKPHHAIHLEMDRFVLSHTINAGSNWVCIIDSSGKLLHSYGSEVGQLKKPRQLAVDRNGFVFVAGVDDNKVPLLNSELKFVKDIIPPSAGLRNIFTVYFDEFRGNLYVSDFEKKTLSVFEMN